MPSLIKLTNLTHVDLTRITCDESDSTISREKVTPLKSSQPSNDDQTDDENNRDGGIPIQTSDRYSTNSTYIRVKDPSKFCHNFILTESGYSVQFGLENATLPENKIFVDFPKFCILGTRRITIEVSFRPESETIELNDGWVLASAVVHICQSENVPFLRKVKVRVPLNRQLDEDIIIENPNRGKTVKIEDGIATVESFKFSPIGVALKTKQVRIPNHIFHCQLFSTFALREVYV